MCSGAIKPAGNLHDARRLSEPLSHYFYVMTNGYGAMPDYKAQVTPEDRWAIAAYIRALQLSQNAKASDVPAGAQVENLSDIAERLGEPASYAGPWPMPSTAVYGAADRGIVAGAPAENPAETAGDEKRSYEAIRSAAIMANESFSKGLPSTVGAPAFVDLWRRRALRAGLVFSILAVILALLGQKQDHPALGWDHVMRGWLEGFMLCFGFCFGGMSLLMVQYLCRAASGD